MYQSDHFLLGKGQQKSGGWKVSSMGRQRTRSRSTFWDGSKISEDFCGCQTRTSLDLVQRMEGSVGKK
jgi:hypothetical protein